MHLCGGLGALRGAEGVGARRVDADRVHAHAVVARLVGMPEPQPHVRDLPRRRLSLDLYCGEDWQQCHCQPRTPV